ncbi:MAG: helix-turn-helix domain-containing protein [Clostridiaceae bacterium]|nr:helix-turn-helix domain-containing protein [Clostridiaceae bacterium]
MARKREPISDDMEELGANIKRYRKENHFTLQELADTLGGTFSTKILSEYEHGYINIGSEAVIAIANALGTTPNELYPAWIVETHTDEAVTGFMRLNEGNKEAVRVLIQTLLKNQAPIAQGVHTA